ncbi:DEAD/DEAH box helicase [Streptomyces rubiginosohelvolus]|uniref:DEAD/DEAH box helicase n=1 Tax=Streptomyces rubiginosohelvolus TaxID=67362 RepID=UPI0035E08EB7
MIDLDPRRYFSSSQRQRLYANAEGRCQRCLTPLDQGWHADHRIPWADGGRTEVENGQALCGLCNLLKGRDMHYRDAFVPRPFQANLIDRVLERISAGDDRTVVLASPGSGKTLAYQSLATRLIREGMIDYLAVFAPRTALAEQCEVDWMTTDASGNVVAGNCELFDATKRLGQIRHVVNEVPLIPGNRRNCGFVGTYSALVTNEETFTRWATRHQGRFLLVADEAQFCGDDTDGGGTRAGELIKKLHEFALHTLLLTGTPYRADNQKLILADYEPHRDSGKERLVRQAEATYVDGIAEGYLRTFEMKLTDARISKRTMSDPEAGRGDSLMEFNLSDDGSELRAALKDERTWQPLVDLVVKSIRDKQKFSRAYRGLISCMQQTEAKKVVKYLRDTYPDLRVGLAISADAGAAGQALEDFKSKPMDLLVTVRMAFIGYDCPEISVVGVLTNYRDEGHLQQLVGRGLRVWKEGPRARQQSCIIVAPDDPKMQNFLNVLRDEEMQGLRIIQEREEGQERGEPVQEAFSYVESSVATTTRAASNDTDVEADDFLLIEGYKVMADSGEDATKLKKILEFAGVHVQSETVPQPRSEPSPGTPAVARKTERAQIEVLKSKAADAVRSELARRGVTPGKPGYGDAMTRANFALKQACGFSADETNTLQRAEKRLQVALNISKHLA